MQCPQFQSDGEIFVSIWRKILIKKRIPPSFAEIAGLFSEVVAVI